MKIYGVEIEETQSLQYNLDKLRYELDQKLGFWYNYDLAIKKYERSKRFSDVSILFQVFLFVALLPKYFKGLFQKSRKEEVIQLAEDELIEYYKRPEFQLRHFRLQCELEVEEYEKELEIIDQELAKHKNHLMLDSIGETTRIELDELIKAFQTKKEKKENKYNFYKDSAKRLSDIEEHLQVKKSIEESKNTLIQLSDDSLEKLKHQEDEKELELFNYYGNLLEDISNNLKRVEADKEEKLEAVELKEMLSVMKAKD